MIIVDDGCVDEVTPAILDRFAEHDDRIKVLHTDNGNRAIARNRGMDAAIGEWICWLDSDDEYSTHYLRELNQATIDFPEYDIFNFGALIYWPDHHSETRPVFRPAEQGTGHEYFRSGGINCGSFAFKRKLWKDKKYRIPDEANPYQFAADSKFPWKLTKELDEWKYDNTDNPEGMFQDGVKRHGSSLGNPWGDDFLQFYLLTRDNKSKPLDIALYIIYPRAHEEVYHHFGEIFETGVDG